MGKQTAQAKEVYYCTTTDECWQWCNGPLGLPNVVLDEGNIFISLFWTVKKVQSMDQF